MRWAKIFGSVNYNDNENFPLAPETHVNHAHPNYASITILNCFATDEINWDQFFCRRTRGEKLPGRSLSCELQCFVRRNAANFLRDSIGCKINSNLINLLFLFVVCLDRWQGEWEEEEGQASHAAGNSIKINLTNLCRATLERDFSLAQ